MVEDREEMLYRAPLAIVGAFIFIMGILAWPGLTAFTGISGNNAGQGVEVVDGFIVTNVSYDATPAANEEDTDILTVSFNIAREGPRSNVVVDYRNAGTFVQLRSDSGRSEWQKCNLDSGYAFCVLEPESKMEVKDITGLSVVAFDSEADNIPFVATGGLTYDTTINGLNYRVHEFKTVGAGTFEVVSIPLVARVDYLIVGGGGGGGGGYAGGGGGAGGVVQGTLNVTTGSYSITVGAGGAASAGNSNSGESSTAFSKTASGGGGGGGRDNWTGLNGASGGGGGWKLGGSAGVSNGGTGIAGQGKSGGNGNSGGGVSMGGGGGGFNSAGSNFTSNTKGGDGGSGLVTSFTGVSRSFAGGGGGGAEPSAAASGLGQHGGGNGGRSGVAATSGTANSGSGGGGAARSLSSPSGAGGSGTVIIRYRIS
jgi:hypothetical protein